MCQWGEQQDKTNGGKKHLRNPFEFWKNSMVHINISVKRQKNRCGIPTISDILVSFLSK